MKNSKDKASRRLFLPTFLKYKEINLPAKFIEEE
ncbi:hypothetical protein N399_02845 [Bacillus licheniformis CG-B52]|nr:hypothetical protein MUY_000545 [Bacillus licheniformis WX-02]EQM29599.1 hypothetical protein N399_02845 [Bacillus licheniformis CG-B52]KUL09792.1 hypothetical protein LI17339_13525 [Bacillus licheniformis LMG 17339]